MNFDSKVDYYIEILKYFNKINEEISIIENQYKLYENIMSKYNNIFDYLLNGDIETYNIETRNTDKNKYMSEYGEIFKFLSKQTDNNKTQNICSLNNSINKHYNNILNENNKALRDKTYIITDKNESYNYNDLVSKYYNNILKENSKVLKNKYNIILNRESDYSYNDLINKYYNNILNENNKNLKNNLHIATKKENSYSYNDLVSKYYKNILNENSKALKNNLNIATKKENNYSYNDLVNKYYNKLKENFINLQQQYNCEKYNIKKKNNIVNLNQNDYNFNDFANTYYSNKLKENNKNLKYNYNTLKYEKENYQNYNMDDKKFFNGIKTAKYKEYNNKNSYYMNFIPNNLYQFEQLYKSYDTDKVSNFKDERNIEASKNRYIQENFKNDEKNLFLSDIYNSSNKNNMQKLLNYINNKRELNKYNDINNISSSLNYKKDDISNYMNLKNTKNGILENKFTDNLYKDYFDDTNNYEQNKRNVFKSYDKINYDKYSSDIYNYKNYNVNDILNKGYNYSLKDYLNSINTINTNNDDILNSKNILHEDLKYLKNTTDSEIINKLENKTISPQIQITFGNIEKSANVDEVLNILSERLEEQFEMSAEGIHI